MKHFVEFPLEEDEGSTILVEVEDSLQGGTQRGVLKPGQVAYEATQTFNTALRKAVRPTAVALIREFRNLPDPPEDVEVKFGIKMNMGVGAVITAGSEANFEVTLKWKKS